MAEFLCKMKSSLGRIAIYFKLCSQRLLKEKQSVIGIKNRSLSAIAQRCFAGMAFLARKFSNQARKNYFLRLKSKDCPSNAPPAQYIPIHEPIIFWHRV